MIKLADVIKYEGDNSTFIWKHPIEDFNSGTQLIVHESQLAIFFINGQAMDSFGPGKHLLETASLPLIGKKLGKVFGSTSAFHAEVYFINLVQNMAIKWGTDSRVEYIEPTYKFPLSFGASGEMVLSVNNGRKLLINLVGTEKELSKETLVSYFRALLMVKIKTFMALFMKTSGISIFQIDEHLSEFSENLTSLLKPEFLEYGVNLNKFYVTRILKPEDDSTYIRFKQLFAKQYLEIAEAELNQKTEIIKAQTEANKKVIDSKAQAIKREQEGYTYQQERGFDVAEGYSHNESSGQFTNLGVGLGTMVGVGGTIGNIIGKAVNDTSNNNQENSNKIFCTNCGSQLNESDNFCPNCGAKVEKRNICKNCGYEFTEPGNFCPKCGMKR